MAIFERLTSSGEPGSPVKIPVHAFAGMVRMRLSNAAGLGATLSTAIIAAFELEAEDQTELAAILTAHNAITNANAGVQAANRLEFAMRVHDTFLACEAGLVTKAQAKTLLGF